jgi:glyoxylase-like metal-dependent hydrolase (beta-lactamase superfamily II)
MRLPGPFELHRVLEFEWPAREPDFLLTGIHRGDILGTRTGQDPAFVDPATGLLIMSFHSLVLRTPAGTLLVDTCVGNHKDRPMLPEWHQQEWPYLERLAQAGLSPADIDFVCCTHLHGDHVGWNTRLDDGRWVPTFPNARYLFARTELAYWEQHHRDDPQSIYRRPWEDSILPVVDAGQVDVVAEEAEILPGIRLQPAPGHTPGNVVIEANDGRRRAVLSGDVIHHPVQVERPDWCSNFDLDQPPARASREALLQRIADQDILLCGAHFAGPSALRVVSEGDGFFYQHV